MLDITFPSFAFAAFFGLLAFLLAFQIDVRLQIVDRIMCSFGRHTYKAKERGSVISKYRCQICDKAKKHPHLKIISGGKKNAIDHKFRF